MKTPGAAAFTFLRKQDSIGAEAARNGAYIIQKALANAVPIVQEHRSEDVPHPQSHRQPGAVERSKISALSPLR